MYVCIYVYKCVYLCIYTHMGKYRYACIYMYIPLYSIDTYRYIYMNGQPFTYIKSIIPSWYSNWSVNPSYLLKSSDHTGTPAVSSKSSKMFRKSLMRMCDSSHTLFFPLFSLFPGNNFSIPAVLVPSHRGFSLTSTASFLIYSFKPFQPRSSWPW